MSPELLDLGIGWPQVIILLVALQRVSELVLAQRNTRRLLVQGAVEHGARHYPLFILLHGGWLIALWLAVPPTAAINAVLLVLFCALQATRIWVIASLGPFWTTRILTLPEAPLVARGPYRWIKHPNYLVVACEIPLLPLVFGAWPLALGFGLANLALLAYRIRVEDAALAPRRSGVERA